MDRPERDYAAESHAGRTIGAHLVCDEDEGVASLARWLAAEGFEVTRTSRIVARTGLRDARIDAGHTVASIPRSARLLIYSSGIPREHPDRLVALRDGIAESSYADVLRSLLARGVGIAVAGRREGRVAAAMIGWTLTQAGLDPAIVLRGHVPQLGIVAPASKSRHAVVDVAETLDAVFGGPPGPTVAVLLDVAAVADPVMFERVVESVGPLGLVLAESKHLAVSAAISSGAPGVESLSLERGSTWWGTDLREDRGRFRFRVFHRGRFAAEIRLRLPGKKSVLSALATVAACERIEVPTRDIKRALEDFAGVSRGFESRGSYRGVTLVDDDAVEPIDVADALALARTLHGRRRLWAVFAPAGPPRLETAEALVSADRVLILAESVDAEEWAGMLEGAGVVARRVATLDQALEDLDRHLEPGDVLLTLGAGHVGTIADAFLRRLPRDRQGR